MGITRIAACLSIYSGDENAMRPERSCSELDLIPLLDKVKLEIESLNCSRSSGLWSFSLVILRADLKFKKRGLRNQDRPPHMAGILPIKFILAENTEDAYLIITSRFNSFRSSLVLSISSAAFPTMT